MILAVEYFESKIQLDMAPREDLQLLQVVFASVPNMQLIFSGSSFEMRADSYPSSLVLIHIFSKTVAITSQQLEVAELPKPFFPHEAAGVTARLVSQHTAIPSG